MRSWQPISWQHNHVDEPRWETNSSIRRSNYLTRMYRAADLNWTWWIVILWEARVNPRKYFLRYAPYTTAQMIPWLDGRHPDQKMHLERIIAARLKWRTVGTNSERDNFEWKYWMCLRSYGLHRNIVSESMKSTMFVTLVRSTYLNRIELLR